MRFYCRYSGTIIACLERAPLFYPNKGTRSQILSLAQSKLLPLKPMLWLRKQCLNQPIEVQSVQQYCFTHLSCRDCCHANRNSQQVFCYERFQQFLRWIGLLTCGRNLRYCYENKFFSGEKLWCVLSSKCEINQNHKFNKIIRRTQWKTSIGRRRI